MLDVVIGLGEKGDVLLQRGAAVKCGRENRRAEQVFALAAGLVLQLLEEFHGAPHWIGFCTASMAGW
ncbi:hypothetical protein D3C71_1966390 [compost metagenome]